MLLRRVTLRWRLVAAFLAVSVPPVLVATYIAAQLMSGTFKHNIERWLAEAAEFLVDETFDSQDEADRAANILAATLPKEMDALSAEWNERSTSLRVFSDLLNSVGYDLVLIYDDKGTVLYRYGAATLDTEPPRASLRSVFTARKDNRPALLVGASRSFERNGETLHVLVANLLDDSFFPVPHAKTSIVIHIYRLQDGMLVPLGPEGGANRNTPMPVPPEAFASLSRGESYTIVRSDAAGDLATGYGAVRDHAGRLVAILTFGLTGQAVFEELIDWRLFAILALIASSLSVTVGLVLARHLIASLHALKRGLREVASGNYRMRVPEHGGQELAEVASGFNAMTSQLERLREMEGEMRRRQQLAALGEAAAVIAHEIRNPLGIIKTSSQVVRQRSHLAPSEERLVGFILDEVDRIDRLVANVLDYVRPNQPNVETVALDGIVQNSLAFFSPEFARRQISCSVETATEVAIEADSDHIHQVLMNLLLNSMEAMPNGGNLTIEVARDDHAGEALLTVLDTGVGMPPNVVLRMFDPFFTTKTKGTGLGLAKVQSVVEEHGGTIACESEPGYGTRIVIRFPLCETKVMHAEFGSDR